MLGFASSMLARSAKKIQVVGSTAISSSSGTFSVAKPSGVRESDLMLCFIGASELPSSPVRSPPPGWTTVAQISAQTMFIIWQKIATGSEPSTYSFQFDFSPSGSPVGGCLCAIRNAEISLIGSISTGTNALSINVPDNNSMLLAMIVASTSMTGYAPDGMSLLNRSSAITPSQVIASQRVGAGVTGNKSFGLSAAVANALQIALKRVQ